MKVKLQFMEIGMKINVVIGIWVSDVGALSNVEGGQHI